MADGFDGLRFDGVVSCNDQNGDIRALELTDQQQEAGVPAREGSPIRRCVAPGVALSYREELRDDTILRRAKVEVEPGGQG